MNRRGFLNALTAFAGTAVLDPERLLWTPGKLISIPKPSGALVINSGLTAFGLNVGDVITFSMAPLKEYVITGVAADDFIFSVEELLHGSAKHV